MEKTERIIDLNRVLKWQAVLFSHKSFQVKYIKDDSEILSITVDEDIPKY